MTEDRGAQSEQSNQSQESDGWDVFYEPAPLYRSIHADGMVVAPSDKDNISVTFYSERIAIPKHVRMSVNSADNSLVETFVSGKQGSIRYLENTVFLTKKTASDLIKWLQSVTEFLDSNDAPFDDKVEHE
jgi:hypothetical protein